MNYRIHCHYCTVCVFATTDSAAVPNGVLIAELGNVNDKKLGLACLNYLHKNIHWYLPTPYQNMLNRTYVPVTDNVRNR